jgi:hypothetical protein
MKTKPVAKPKKANGNGGNDTFVGASGTEILSGSAFTSDDTFLIGTGVTTAYGSGGNDIYSYAAGDGQLTIFDPGGTNVLVLGAGSPMSGFTKTYPASAGLRRLRKLRLMDTSSGRSFLNYGKLPKTCRIWRRYHEQPIP